MEKIKQFISTTELAKRLGVSRTAIHYKIESGEIKAHKVGRNYVIATKDLPQIFGGDLSNKMKKDIDKVVQRTIHEYGETLRLLARD